MSESELNTCPKCGAPSATTEVVDGQTSRFYCSLPACDFEVLQQKQDFSKALKQLQKAKEQFASKH